MTTLQVCVRGGLALLVALAFAIPVFVMDPVPLEVGLLSMTGQLINIAYWIYWGGKNL